MSVDKYVIEQRSDTKTVIIREYVPRCWLRRGYWSYVGIYESEAAAKEYLALTASPTTTRKYYDEHGRSNDCWGW